MRPVSFALSIIVATAVAALTADLLQAQTPVPVTSPAYVEAPPPRQETITVAPSPQTVWVPGSWERTPDAWSWVNGQWVTPPFRRAYSGAGLLAARRRAVSMVARSLGRRKSGGGRGPKSRTAGADARDSAVAPHQRQQPGLVPGHWEWRGTWVWIAGQYVVTSNPQAVWVPGEWDPAADGSWRWNPAHWSAR